MQTDPLGHRRFTDAEFIKFKDDVNSKLDILLKEKAERDQFLHDARVMLRLGKWLSSIAVAGAGTWAYFRENIAGLFK